MDESKAKEDELLQIYLMEQTGTIFDFLKKETPIKID